MAPCLAVFFSGGVCPRLVSSGPGSKKGLIELKTPPAVLWASSHLGTSIEGVRVPPALGGPDKSLMGAFHPRGCPGRTAWSPVEPCFVLTLSWGGQQVPRTLEVPLNYSRVNTGLCE